MCVYSAVYKMYGTDLIKKLMQFLFIRKIVLIQIHFYIVPFKAVRYNTIMPTIFFFSFQKHFLNVFFYITLSLPSDSFVTPSVVNMAVEVLLMMSLCLKFLKKRHAF